jgi:hypothetical protein
MKQVIHMIIPTELAQCPCHVALRERSPRHRPTGAGVRDRRVSIVVTEILRSARDDIPSVYFRLCASLDNTETGYSGFLGIKVK